MIFLSIIKKAAIAVAQVAPRWRLATPLQRQQPESWQACQDSLRRVKVHACGALLSPQAAGPFSSFVFASVAVW